MERVTRRFYDRFRAELTAFGNFIEGITTQGDRDWYASLMLNRMMFVYFVQKQGFLDGRIIKRDKPVYRFSSASRPSPLHWRKRRAVSIWSGTTRTLPFLTRV